MLSFKDLKLNLKKDCSSFPKIKIALLGDSSTQFLATALKGWCVEMGYNVDFFESDYDQIELQFMDKESDLFSFNAQFIIVFQSTHKWNLHYSILSQKEQCKLADSRLFFVKTICSLTDAKIIYFNYPEIDDGVFGSYANKVESSFSFQVRKINYELMRLSQTEKNLFICDIASVQNKFGRNFLFDPVIYTNTEMVLSLDAVPIVAKRVMDIISSLQGRVKKCLIIDLDNTIWGGVIGDDGLEGIQLGHGLGIGKAYSEFQLWIKKLKNRGIVVCVCSKNDELIAKEPFEKHPDMVLRLDDISVFIANWQSKVDNIRQIQQVLNIGFDSMVFIDDNPFERNIVKENIPEITVPNMPEDPSLYLEYLCSLNLFETASFSVMDKDRAKLYQIQADRANFRNSFTNESDFLKSLNMKSKVEGLTKFNIPRIAQLSQRSNQFNLRTVRYTETDLEIMSTDCKVFPLSFSLEDKFGDNGLIAVVIMKSMDEDLLFIDSWFMSCRVLKRGMEFFTLNEMVKIARQHGFKRIVGEYLPTSKNGLVKDLYLNLNFTPIENGRYELVIDNYEIKKCFIKEE